MFLLELINYLEKQVDPNTTYQIFIPNTTRKGKLCKAAMSFLHLKENWDNNLVNKMYPYG